MRPASMAALALIFGLFGISNVMRAAPVRKAVFKTGVSSTGWIDFEFQDEKRIFIPAKINGHETTVLLATGLPISDIDKTFAASIGLQAIEESHTAATGSDKTSGLIRGIQIQIGDMSLQNTVASPVDFAPLARHIGHPLPLLLGDDAFNGLAVDIDFAHHRIAFSDPASQARPDDAIEVPLTQIEGIPLIPVSIEGGPPAQFELGIGNSGEILIYQSYYEAHKLLEGRRLSKRLAAGSNGFVTETVATLNRADFAGLTFGSMPAAFIPASVTGPQSSLIAGDVGLPVLARFRLIIDYSHNRLYAVPYADAEHLPFARDRLGLSLNKEGSDFAVEFVAPNSPSQAIGFRVGDRIALIDGKSPEAWPETLFANLKYRASGTNLVFTMQDGGIRQVKLADYF